MAESRTAMLRDCPSDRVSVSDARLGNDAAELALIPGVTRVYDGEPRPSFVLSPSGAFCPGAGGRGKNPGPSCTRRATASRTSETACKTGLRPLPCKGTWEEEGVEEGNHKLLVKSCGMHKSGLPVLS
eukprot:scaffold1282_cov251-Pinguiococcus_pyrenoidosus.AAC.63